MTTAAIWWTDILECCAGREVAPRRPKRNSHAVSCSPLIRPNEKLQNALKHVRGWAPNRRPIRNSFFRTVRSQDLIGAVGPLAQHAFALVVPRRGIGACRKE